MGELWGTATNPCILVISQIGKNRVVFQVKIITPFAVPIVDVLASLGAVAAANMVLVGHKHSILFGILVPLAVVLVGMPTAAALRGVYIVGLYLHQSVVKGLVDCLPFDQGSKKVVAEKSSKGIINFVHAFYNHNALDIVLQEDPSHLFRVASIYKHKLDVREVFVL